MTSEQEPSRKASAVQTTTVSPDIARDVSSSRRAIGHSWKVGNEHSILFGAGGPQDGTTPLIQTFCNRMKEDEMALHGMGERSLDENRFQRAMANSNPEFNFQMYKTGMAGERVHPALTVFEGLGHARDSTVNVDGNQPMVDQTTSALGGIYERTWKDGSYPTQYNAQGPDIIMNPFATNANRPTKEQTTPNEEVAQPDDPFDDPEIDYYYKEEYTDGEQALREIQNDKETGLRRVNIRASQRRQLDRVAQKEDVMAALQSVIDDNDLNTAKFHKSAYHSPEEKERMRELFRTPTSKFQSSQVGVGEASRKSAKAYSKRAHQPNKLNAVLVGV